MILGTNGKNKLEGIICDLKSFTSRPIKKSIENDPLESRKEWMLWIMRRAGNRNSNNKDFQFWQHHNHPIELIPTKVGATLGLYL